MFQNADLTVREYIEMLRRRRWFIAAVTVSITVLAMIPVAMQSPVYSSSAEIQLRSELAASAFSEEDYENEVSRSRELITAANIITNRQTRAQVQERLGTEGLPFDSVQAQVVDGFSEIVRITVTAPSAAGATEAANAFAEVYVELRQRASTAALQTQETQLRTQAQEIQLRLGEIDQQLASPELQPTAVENLRQERALLASQFSEYSRRADELSVDAELRRGASSVASRAPLRMTPIAPKPFRSGLIAFAVAFLIGVCFAIFLEVIRDRISNSDEMDSIDPDLTVLATVPHVDIDLDDPDHRLPPLAVEAFRYLWTAIRFRSLENPVRSLVITSALSGEGKTTTAINLAMTLADSGSRVVLIDADMRKAAVHSRMGVANEHGLSSVVAGKSSFGDALRFVRPNLAVMTAGHPTAAATDLLGDARFLGMVKAVENQCDLVIIDAPPVLPVADALLAARAVDTTLVVGRLGVVRRRDLKATIRRMNDAKIPVLGMVANDSPTGTRYGGYYAEYGDPVEIDA